MGHRRRKCRKRVTHTVMAGAIVLGGGAVAATPERLYQDEVADDGGGQQSAELSDDTLHGFVEAAHEIRAIRAEYTAKIRDAAPQDRAALQAEAAERMAEAVEDQGLEVSEYREIGWLLDNDADLPARLDRIAAKSDGT